MFGGGATNPYDEIIAKATDENQTAENWEIILNLCDKVAEEGQEGAKNAVAALIKRLTHRNPNVQLYALSLAEALTKNLGIELHRELASKAFTQALERIITDRTTHDKVKRRALQLVAECTAEFENDTSLGIMEDLYNNLKAKNYKFESTVEPLPPAVDDEIRRKEEEELQRVLEMSMHDKGGRSAWSDYSLAAGSSSGPTSSSTSKPLPSTSAYGAPKYQAGYVPARTPSPTTQQRYRSPEPEAQPSHSSFAAAQPATATSAAPAPTESPAQATGIVTRVRALHTFEPTEPGELAFEKGDIIKVVDRGYKDWWRGQLKGRTGIFPVNYVEPMPEPTAAELAKEAEQEAAVFSQAVNVEKLLNMLRTLDPDKDNLADNEEIQELYRSCMSLRPKIVKLIDKYSQKRADLVSMNETFIRARTIFDRMMEESLARHTGVYDQPPYRPSQYPQGPVHGRPMPPAPAHPPSVPQGYGWNPNVYQQPGYNAYPAPAAAYPAQQGQPPQGHPPLGPQPYPPQQVPAQAAPAQGPPTPAAAPQPQAYGYNAPYGQPAPGGYNAPPPQAQQQQLPAQPQVVQGVPPGPAPAAAPAVVPQAQPAPQQPVQRQSLLDEEPLPDPYSNTPAPAPQSIQLPQSLQPTVIQSPVVQTPPVAFGPSAAAAQSPSQQQQLPLPFASAPQIQPQPQLQHTQSTNSVSQAQSPQGTMSQSPVEQVQHVQPLQQVQPQPQVQVQAQPIQQQAAAQQQHQPEPTPAQQHPQPQPQRQNTLPHTQPVEQQQAQPTQAEAVASSPPASADNGPPYVYNPATTYADPNVQAWAQYYAQGGTDPAGAVYFVSAPGVKPAPGEGGGGAVVGGQSQVQQQQQPQQQPQPQPQPQQAASSPIVGPHAKRYQLTDSGFVGGGGGGAKRRDSGEVSDWATSPQQQQQQAGPAGGSAQATPSWVLPKRGGI